MDWIEGVSRALDFIESNLTEKLDVEEIAGKAYVSGFYFQKAFSMLCGLTIGEYIRRRRLSQAGSELITTDIRVIDLAMKYGYDSPDSFTKAFTRFHGATPIAVRKDGAVIKSFAPLRIKLTLEGGYIMDYKIIEKATFTVMGVTKVFKYDEAKEKIPEFWAEHVTSGRNKTICGEYGINIDSKMTGVDFEYTIADNYNPAADIPEGFVTKTFEKGTWAVFPCKGAMPEALQTTNKKIFTEWLPNNKEYEIASGCCIEMYSNPSDFAKGTLDKDYYSEMWIPVKKKA